MYEPFLSFQGFHCQMEILYHILAFCSLAYNFCKAEKQQDSRKTDLEPHRSAACRSNPGCFVFSPLLLGWLCFVKSPLLLAVLRWASPQLHREVSVGMSPVWRSCHMALIERGGAGRGVAFLEGCHRTLTTLKERSKGWLEVRRKDTVVTLWKRRALSQ